jgi:hypothetical protein
MNRELAADFKRYLAEYFLISVLGIDGIASSLTGTRGLAVEGGLDQRVSKLALSARLFEIPGALSTEAHSFLRVFFHFGNSIGTSTSVKAVSANGLPSVAPKDFVLAAGSSSGQSARC